MSDIEHTPGPWSIVEDEVNNLTQAISIDGPDGRPVIQANSDYDRSLQRRGDVLFLDAHDVDLQLATIAPELLAACEAAEEALAGIVNDWESVTPDEQQALQQLRDAIAKAKGRQ